MVSECTLKHSQSDQGVTGRQAIDDVAAAATTSAAADKGGHAHSNNNAYGDGAGVTAPPTLASKFRAHAAPETAADRALEPPFLKAQQAAQGTGNHWLHERMPDVESHPAWISTMADDIALATSFWR